MNRADDNRGNGPSEVPIRALVATVAIGALFMSWWYAVTVHRSEELERALATSHTLWVLQQRDGSETDAVMARLLAHSGIAAALHEMQRRPAGAAPAAFSIQGTVSKTSFPREYRDRYEVRGEPEKQGMRIQSEGHHYSFSRSGKRLVSSSRIMALWRGGTLEILEVGLPE